MPDTNTYETVFVARQPVFDRELRVWGYELLYRDKQSDNRAEFSDEIGATIKVMANVSLCPDADFRPAKIMINFPSESIISDMPRAFLPERTVVALPEYMAPSAELIDALSFLKRDGYTIAVDKLSPMPLDRALGELADIVAVDLRLSIDETESLAGAVPKRDDGPLLMAKGVEDLTQLDRAQRLGCTLFQGFFFQEPVTLSGRKISSGEMTRLKLFDIIEKEDPDFQALAATIESDVSLSYRLLTFLNSAAFSFTQKITSIRQAVVLAGWRQLKGWLRLVLLTDMAPPTKTQELCFLSAQRGKFLELASGDLGDPNLSDRLFMLGLFSLLEPMLDVPMAEIVRYLPLEEDVKNALCRRESPLAEWLELAETIEKSRWEEADRTMLGLKISPDTAASAYQRSIEWANTFFGSI